jgi:hypothetical protein
MATTSEASSEQSPVEDARDELQSAVPEAAATLRELLAAEDERVTSPTKTALSRVSRPLKGPQILVYPSHVTPLVALPGVLRRR